MARSTTNRTGGHSRGGVLARGGVLGLLARRVALGGAATLACAAPVWAGPEGATVQAGHMSFAQSGNLTRITAANNTIINWQSFNIGRNETVQFIQPSATSRVLNRITSADPTRIEGTILANGIVYIVNPSGVYFRQGALVDVGGIYAAAGNLSDRDFMAGRNQFTDVTGRVMNEGLLRASGNVSLVGQFVGNSGEIHSSGGTVMMAAGDEVLVGERGGNVFARITPGPQSGTGSFRPTERSGPGVENSGTIDARGGRVSLATGDVYGIAIRQTGNIRGRDVSLDGGRRGTVEVGGTIDARGGENERGGRVRVTGETVHVRGAQVDAGGGAGGGEIYVGGGFQGQGDLRRANTTIVGPGSRLSADATNAGESGGTVVVYSAGYTGFYGVATARGGEGGKGGVVETSGLVALDVREAVVDAGATNGVGGLWLLDPRNVTIDNGGTFANPFVPSAGNTVVDVTILTTTLEGGTNVEVRTTDATGSEAGNITVNAAIAPAMNGATGATLTLRAANDINVNAPITASGTRALSVTLSANDQGLGDDLNTATGAVNINAAITTNNGALLVSNGAGTISGFTSSAAGVINTGTGNVNIVTSGLASVGASITGASLNLQGSTINLAGGTVTTTGAQTYTTTTTSQVQGLTLGAGLTLSTTNADVTFNNTTGGFSAAGGTIRGANALSISAGTGTVTFNTPVGFGIAPTSVDVTAARTNINGSTFVTTGSQSFSGTVVVDAAANSTSISGTSITFGGAVRGATDATESLTVTGTGAVTFNGAVGDNAQRLTTLTVNGTGGSVVLAGGSVSTSDAQSYANAVTLGGAATTLTAGGSGVSFASTVNASSAGAQSLSISGDAGFAGAVGGTAALGSLAVSGNSVVNAGTIATTNGAGGTGNQTFTGTVSLGTSTAFNSTGGTVAFGGALDGTSSGGQSLTVGGDASFAGSVGQATPLRSVSVSGTATMNTASINTTSGGGGTGNQSYGSATLGGANGTVVNLTASGGTVSFGNSPSAASAGQQGLLIAGNAAFAGNVNAAALRSLQVTGSTTFTGQGLLTSTAGGGSGAQSYTGAVTVGGANGNAPNLTGSTITFNSTVNAAVAGQHGLTVTGDSVFNAAVGASSALRSLAVTGTTALNTTDVRTTNAAAGTGNQSYGGAVTLTGSGNGSTINLQATGGTVAFGGSVNAAGAGQQGLTVTGGASFGGNVGQSAALRSLTVTQAAAINTASISTTDSAGGTGAQSFQGATTLGTDATLTGSSITFGGQVNGTNAGQESLTITGPAVFADSVGAGTRLEALSVSGAASIGSSVATQANQTYSGAVTLAGGNGTTHALSSTAGTVAFQQTVEATSSGQQGLAVTGNATFGGAVGATNALRDLSVSGTSSVNTTAIRTTSAAGGSGNQTFTGATTLGTGAATTVTLTASGGTVAFGGSLNASGAGAERLNVAGNANFGGSVGGTNALGAVDVSGTSTFAAGTTIATSTAGGSDGHQAYAGNSTIAGAVGGAATFSAGSGNVTFSGLTSAAGGARGVTVNTSGETRLGTIGTLATITTDAGGTTFIGGTFTAAAADFGDDVVLTANTSVTNSGEFRFRALLNGTSAGSQSLALSGAGRFDGAVGGNTSLSTLAVGGAAALNGGSVATTGTQSYGAATLGADTTLTGSTITFTSTLTGANSGTESLTVTGNAAFGGTVGVGNALEALSVSGATAINTTAVTTANAQVYTGAVTLGNAGGTTATLTASGVTFGGPVNGSSADQQGLAVSGNATLNGNLGDTNRLASISISGSSTLTGSAGQMFTLSAGSGGIALGALDSAAGGARNVALNSTGTTALNGAVGATNALGTLTTDAAGTTTLSGGSIVAAGATFNDAVVLGAATTITDTAGVVFANTLSSDGTNRALSITGNATFGGVVGAGSALSTLSVSGSTALNTSAVTSTSTQTYTGAVTLGGASGSTTTLTASGVTFGGTVNAGTADQQSLAVAGGATFGNSVGVTTRLAGLSVSGTTTVGGSAGGTITLNTGSGGIALGAVNSAGGGARNLTLNSTGTTALSGAIGSGAALGTLTTDAAGSTVIGAGTIVAGGTTFNDALTLTANLTITDAVGVSFNNTVDSDGTPRSLAVNGSALFGGVVGGSSALSTLSVSGTSALNTSAITTTGTQTYTGASTLGGTSGSTITLTASGVSFGGTLNASANGQQGLAVVGAGTFGGNVGGNAALGSLSVSGTATLPASVTTSTAGGLLGHQTYQSNLQLAQDTTLSTGGASGGTIFFGGTVNGTTGGSESLTIDGNASFAGTVGGSTALEALSVSGATAINGSGVFTTGAGGQSYTSIVELGAAPGSTVTLSAGTAPVSFGSAVRSAAGGARGLTIVTSGTTDFGGNVGDAGGDLLTLTTGAGLTVLGGSVTTTGAQTYIGDLRLTTDVALTAGGTGVAFQGNVDGTTPNQEGLTVNGPVSFAGALGGTTPLEFLTLTGLLTLSGNTTFTLNAVSIGSVAGGGFNLTLVATTTAAITGNVTNVGTLAVTGTGGIVLTSGTTIETNAGQTYTGSVTIDGATDQNVTLTAGGDVLFTGTIDSATGGARGLAVNTAGATTFGGNVGSAAALFEVRTDAPGTLVLPASIATTGDHFYGENIALAQATSFTSDTGRVTFGGTIDGAQALTITGNAAFTQAVGVGAALTSLTVSGGANLHGGTVTTTGAQSYGSGSVLTADATLNASTVTFTGTLDGTTAGAEDLTINAEAVFGGNVGQTVALGEVGVSGSASIAGDITTTAQNGGSGQQSYGGVVTLAGSNDGRRLTGTLITFNDDVLALNGGVQGLIIGSTNTPTDAVFGGRVGDVGNELLGLAVTGTTILNGGAVTTVTDQVFAGAVTIGQDTTFTSSAGDVRFQSTLDAAAAGTQGASIVGDAQIDGNVGSVAALRFFGVTGAAQVGATSIVTTGNGGQTFGAQLTLTGTPGQTLTLDAGTGPITLSNVDSAGDGSRSLALNSSGTTTFGGAVGSIAGLGSIETDLGGTVVLNTPTINAESVSFAEAVQLAQDVTITVGGAASFASTIDSQDATARALTINAGDTITVSNAVGSTFALSTFTLDGGNGTLLAGGSVNTTGDQTYGRSVTIDTAGNTSTFTSTGGTIRFIGALDAVSAAEEAVTIAGNARFDGDVGGQATFTTLDVSGSTFFGGVTVTTTGDQSYGGAVVVGGAVDATTTLEAGGGNVTFGSTIDSDTGGPRNLAVNSTGTTLFMGAIGETELLGGLSTNAGGSTRLHGGSIKSTGPVGFADDVVLSANTTIQTTGENVAFAGTVTGAFNLTVNADIGEVSFAGDLGTMMAALGSGTGAAISLGGTGPAFFNGQVFGASGIVATGAVTFRENVLLAAGDTASNFMGDVTFDGMTFAASGDATFGDSTTDQVTLSGGPVVLSSETGNFTINARVDGAQDLQADVDLGNLTFNAAIGSATPLNSLTLAGASINLGVGSVTTTGAANFNGNVVLTSGLVLDTTGAGTVPGGAAFFGGTVNGPFNLTINSGTATTMFDAAVGDTTAIGTGTGAAITLASTGATIFGQAVSAASGIVAAGDVTFRNDVNLGNGDTASIFSGSVTLDRAALASNDLLLFNAADGVTFGSATAGEDLLALVGAAGDNLGISITTTASPVVFNARVEGNQDLAINAGAAEVRFNAAVGGADSTTRIGDGTGRALDIGGTGTATFTSTLSTNARIAIGGNALFQGNVTLGDGDGDGPSTIGGNTTLAGIVFTAAEGVTFGDAATDTITLSTGATTVAATVAGADVTFSGLLDGAQSLTVSTANDANSVVGFGAAVGSTAPLLRLVTTAGVTTGIVATSNIAGNITTVNGVDVGHRVFLAGNSVIQANNVSPDPTQGQLLFRATIDSQAGTPRSLTLLTNATMNSPSVNTDVSNNNNIAFRNYLIPILFGGSIGATNALSAVNLNFNPAGNTDVRPSGSVPAFSTIVFSPRIDANGFIQTADVTSTLINSTTFTIRTSNNGTFTQGFNEKILAFGSLTINAPGGTSRVRIGDITTLGSLTVTGGTIEIRARGSSFLAGYSDGGLGLFGQDVSVDYVAGGSIDFNGNLVVRNQAGTAPSGIRPSFATPTGANISGTGSLVQRAFGPGDLRDQFADRGVGASGRFLPFDLQTTGPTNTNVSETIAAFAVIDVPRLPQTTVIPGALEEALKDIGIYVNRLGPEQLIEFLVGRDLYNDLPGFTRPGEGDRRVSEGRLSFDLISLVLARVEEIKQDSDAFKAALGEAYDAYTAANPDDDFSPTGFRDFVRMQDEASPARTIFASLAAVYRLVDQLGLGPLETLQCKKAIALNVAPGNLSAENLIAAVEAPEAVAMKK